MIVEEIRDISYGVDFVFTAISNDISSPIRGNSPESITLNARLNTSSSIGTSKEISHSFKNLLEASSDDSPYQSKPQLSAVKENPSKELGPESILDTFNTHSSDALHSAGSIQNEDEDCYEIGTPNVIGANVDGPTEEVKTNAVGRKDKSKSL